MQGVLTRIGMKSVSKVSKPPTIEAEPQSVAIKRDEFRESLAKAASRESIDSIREEIAELKRAVSSKNGNHNHLVSVSAVDEQSVSLVREVLMSELDQILESRTAERARYYIKRLQRGIEEKRTLAVNDINLRRWKEYSDVITDSLWNLPKRDTAGAHLGWYWGNFIPQIPHQLMLRYTKRHEWVLDPFLGSGTTLIECRRLGRNGIGVELNPAVAGRAKELVEKEPNKQTVLTSVVEGDSRIADLRKTLSRAGAKSVQLVIMHPPYHDIISFSDDQSDLSNATGSQDFLEMFGQVLDNTTRVLDNGRYLAVVIGDKYQGGEWIPLGFMCMSEVLKRSFSLKSIIVKNFDETRAKRDQKQLWRYRALVGGFYIFKHEYILLFRKK
jgi:DNA modification methylase